MAEALSTTHTSPDAAGSAGSTRHFVAQQYLEELALLGLTPFTGTFGEDPSTGELVVVLAARTADGAVVWLRSSGTAAGTGTLVFSSAPHLVRVPNRDGIASEQLLDDGIDWFEHSDVVIDTYCALDA